MEPRDQQTLADKGRKSRNDDLIRRYRNGESLCAVDGKSTWFPPRPIIQKDAEAVRKLYGDDEPKDQASPPRRGLVLTLGNHRDKVDSPEGDGGPM